MEPFEERNPNEHETPTTRPGPNQWLLVVLIVVLAIAGIAGAYGLHERGMVNQLKEQAAATNNAMNQLQTQVNTLTAKLNDMPTAQTTVASSASAAPASPAPAASTIPNSEDTTEAISVSPPVVVAPAKPAPAKRPAAKRRAPADKRYAQLKSQLDEQQKQLKETQDAVAKNRSDLEGTINSTRDELNGSIAKTHEELVALEKRGERSYFEFDLSKSKQFQRFGPLTLSLRKADTKHKNYDVAMIVDDNELTKKKVNLYEPIWIHTENGAQPVQVVVNRIEKNLVHGYVSAPKYKQSELAAMGSSAPAVTPTSGDARTAQQPQQ
jgi:HPt (histidine-containing phosphotransfer) domain-containing protein